MKIRLLSDLHHEFKKSGQEIMDYFEYKGEDVLVLAGDIAVGFDATLLIIKKFKAAGFPNIIYIPGNHEYYGGNIETFDSLMEKESKYNGGFYFLNPNHVTINDVVFIGGALWTDFGGDPLAELQASDYVSDFKLIRKSKDNRFYTEDAIDLKYYHFDYIKKIYELYPNKKKVVVSHFLPSYHCVDHKYRNSRDELLNKYFANTNMDDFIAHMQDSIWLHGHTHDSVDKYIGDTRVICNPYGYHNNSINKSFDPFKVIEV